MSQIAEIGFYRDSIQKIEKYLKELDKPLLIVLPSFFQKYKCPCNCGGCCGNFSLDFLPKEYEKFKKYYPKQANQFRKRVAENGLTIYTYLCSDENEVRCDFFLKGKCSIHKLNPFSCSFELNKVRQLEPTDLPWDYTNIGKAFYRDKNMTTFEGKPLKCVFGEYTEEDKWADIKVLERLGNYYFQARKEPSINLLTFVQYLRSTPLEIIDITKSLYFFECGQYNYEQLKIRDI